jgi:hypothetical protein
LPEVVNVRLPNPQLSWLERLKNFHLTVDLARLRYKNDSISEMIAPKIEL